MTIPKFCNFASEITDCGHHSFLETFKMSTQKQLLGFVRASRPPLPCLPFKTLTGRLARAPREKGIFLF